MTRLSMCVALALLLPASALAEFQLQFSNTARAEHYDNSGNPAIATFPNAGGQFYDELSLNFRHSEGRYSHWSGQAQLLFNNSRYRNDRFGTELERFNLTRENGRAAAPYRLQLGDWFGFFSLRSLQRSLKGVQLELQPRGGLFGIHKLEQSFVFLAGTSDARWRDYHADDDLTVGASWLLQSPSIGRWSANVVHRFDEQFIQFGGQPQHQLTASLATQQEWQIHQQQLSFEIEYGYFNGDHAGAQNVSDQGIMAQLQGRSGKRPFDWRFRFERYGQDYRPGGASVSSNRGSAELHANYRTRSGFAIRGRLQGFRDQLESADPTDTHTGGLSVSGKLPWQLTGSLDGFLQRTFNDSRSSARRSSSLNLSFSRPFAGGITARFGSSWQVNRDEVRGGSPSINRQYRFNLNLPVAWWGWKGSLAPGLSFRHNTNAQGASDDISPQLALNLAKQRHSLSLATNVNQQNRTNGADAQTRSVNAAYRWSGEQDSVGLEVSWQERRPEAALSNGGTKVSLFWNRRFDSRQYQQRRQQAAEAAKIAEFNTEQPLRISALPPGSDVIEAGRLLMAYGATPLENIPRHGVYEYPLLPTLSQRQRVVLMHRAGVLRTTALIIDVDDIGNPDSLQQTFEQVRERLIQRYGSPSDFFERGDFNPVTLAEQLDNNQFIRNFEWTLPQGVLRLGIPRRLDRQIRIEVQYRAAFGDARDTLWSLDEVQ